MTDAELRQILLSGPPEDCDRDGDVVRAVAGDLPADELPALLEHVRGCPACARCWSDVRASLAEGDDVEVPTPANTPWRWGLLGALAVAAAVALAVLTWPAGSDVTPDWRAGGGDGVELALPDGATAVDRILRWEPVDGAYAYTVHVTAIDLSPVHEASVTVPELTLPAELSGRQLLWQVTAQLGDGTVRRSATRTVVVP